MDLEKIGYFLYMEQAERKKQQEAEEPRTAAPCNTKENKKDIENAPKGHF